MCAWSCRLPARRAPSATAMTRSDRLRGERAARAAAEPQAELRRVAAHRERLRLATRAAAELQAQRRCGSSARSRQVDGELGNARARDAARGAGAPAGAGRCDRRTVRAVPADRCARRRGRTARRRASSSAPGVARRERPRRAPAASALPAEVLDAGRDASPCTASGGQRRARRQRRGARPGGIGDVGGHGVAGGRRAAGTCPGSRVAPSSGSLNVARTCVPRRHRRCRRPASTAVTARRRLVVRHEHGRPPSSWCRGTSASGSRRP